MTPDWLRRPGVILFTENYEACVSFYRDTVGLPVMFEKVDLVTLRFGDGYLMVETGGVGLLAGKNRAQSPVTLRFNVADVEDVAATLQGRGVKVDVRTFDWGTVGVFNDPDGNRCELRDDDATFRG